MARYNVDPSPSPTPTPTPSSANPSYASGAAAAGAADAAGTGGGTSAADQPVNLGTPGGSYQGSTFVPDPTDHQHSGASTVAEAQNSIRSWSKAEQDAFAQSVYKMGLVKDPNDWLAVVAVWEAAVSEAASWYAAGNTGMTPWSVLPLLATSTNKPGAGGSTGPKRTSQESTSIPTVLGAKATITAMFQNALGRDPSKGELDRYTNMLVGTAKKKPTVTTTDYSYDKNGQIIDTKSNTTGGFDSGDQQQAVTDSVKGTKEYGAYQAATTYYNTLMQMVGGAQGVSANGVF